MKYVGHILYYEREDKKLWDKRRKTLLQMKKTSNIQISPTEKYSQSKFQEI